MRNRSTTTIALVACLLALPHHTAQAGPAAASPPAPHGSAAPALQHTPAEAQEMMASLEAYDTKMETTLRASASPRDRALSTQIPHFSAPPYIPSMGYDPVRGALLRKAAEAAPRDALVQWIWANASAGASGCDTPASCPTRGRALALIEPDNAAAWIPAVARAHEAKDAAAVDDALAHMAAARRYDDKASELANAWTEVMRLKSGELATAWAELNRRMADAPAGITGDTPVGDGDQEMVANMTAAHGMSVGFSVIHTVEVCSASPQCGGDPRRATWCTAVARRMASGSTLFPARFMAMYLLDQSTFATPADHQLVRVAIWQYVQYMQLAKSAEGNPALVQRLDFPPGDRLDSNNMKAVLVRAKVPLVPPAGWSPPPETEHASGCSGNDEE